MDLHKIQLDVKCELREQHQAIVRFLHDLLTVPINNGHIAPAGNKIGEMMVQLGFDEVRCDTAGSILGRVGNGPRKLLYDCCLDTVSAIESDYASQGAYGDGDKNDVRRVPAIFGEQCSTPPIIHAMATLKKLEAIEGWSLYYFGNARARCEGMAAQALVEYEGIRPDFVIVGEPTGMQIHRGHRGHVEISATFRDHGNQHFTTARSGDPLCSALPFVQGIEQLDLALQDRPADQLGRGSIVVTSMRAHNARPETDANSGFCTVYLDRYTQAAETKEEVLDELRTLPNAHLAEIAVPLHDLPSYTGFVFHTEKYFSSWILAEDHPYVHISKLTFESCYSRRARTGTWDYPTSACYWAGKADIPTIGFGPGQIHRAQMAANETVAEVVQCADFYAMLPLFLARGERTGE